MARQLATSLSVDLWRMALAAGACVALAFLGRLFVRLLLACFWLPGKLKQNEESTRTALKEIPEGAPSPGDSSEAEGGEEEDEEGLESVTEFLRGEDSDSSSGSTLPPDEEKKTL